MPGILMGVNFNPLPALESHEGNFGWVNSPLRFLTQIVVCWYLFQVHLLGSLSLVGISVI